MTTVRYRLGPILFDPVHRRLTRGGDSTHVTPKESELLLALIEHQGQVIDKEALLRSVWPDACVEEGNLTQNISLLRRALGDTTEQPRFIETIPRHGYRLVAPVEVIEADSTMTVHGQSPAGRALIATAFLLVWGGLFYFLGRGTAPRPSEWRTVAVAGFLNRTGDPQWNAACREAYSAAATALRELGGISLVDASRPHQAVLEGELAAAPDGSFILSATIRPRGGGLPLWRYQAPFNPASPQSASVAIRASLAELLRRPAAGANLMKDPAGSGLAGRGPLWILR